MIDTLVIVVYNRLHNLETWFNILKQCDRPKNVVVIHNTDENYYNIPEDIIYIRRKNIGFDIGAFQDVCLNRLPGFPEWDQLLWVTDDTFPMAKDFCKYFDITNEGVRCMEISPYVREHIRTTGFSITKTVAQKLKFPADPIVTKDHCYLFEHRDRYATFMNQIKAMNLPVKMVATREVSPLFDTGYHRRVKRETEMNNLWNLNKEVGKIQDKKVTIICPIYKSFPAVISSLIMQTFKDWKLLLIHDGPGEGEIKAYVELINDDRIEYLETEKHAGNWGHSIRSEYLQKVESEFVLITNPDNYYTPVFLEYMLKPLKNGYTASYCSQMVHSYLAWNTQVCKLVRGHVDCGGVLLKTDKAKSVGWHSMEHSADWFFFEAIIKKYGAGSFIPIKGTLFVHN